MKKSIINEINRKQNTKTKENKSLINSKSNFRKLTRLKLEKNYMKYIENESSKILKLYENDFYLWKKNLEKNTPQNHYILDNHKINNLLRAKLVDWMILIFDSYSSETQTFFLAIQILDLYFYLTSKTLKTNDLHLIGITCIYIASQFEDLFPIQLNEIINQISSDFFNKIDILNKEIEILFTIKFSLLNSTTYDFINLYVFDFYDSNKDKINKLNIEKYLDIIENTSIFLSKMLCLYDYFSNILPSIKALCCIICAFDIFQSNCKNLNEEVIDIFKGWIILLIEESDSDEKYIEFVYNKIIEFYNMINYDLYLGKNLKLTFPLYFT